MHPCFDCQCEDVGEDVDENGHDVGCGHPAPWCSCECHIERDDADAAADLLDTVEPDAF